MASAWASHAATPRPALWSAVSTQVRLLGSTTEVNAPVPRIDARRRPAPTPGLKPQSSAVPANAGEHFLLGRELREQRTRTLTLIDNATSCGRTRVAEMNQQVADNLDRMIGELDDGQDEGEETADAG
ncbi:hypothetical protein [Streptomyces sp. uw30]|uniref:hypothetical protein n=1 Tax=Streptomyces sp. uw30 TaxID=1828179 RepID=UPI0021C6523C|nr:hypothetical protein [Streptomyces sp. uw30]